MKINRRNFIGKAALAAILGTQIVPSRVLGRGGVSPNGKINMAIIGNGLISEGHRKYFAWCKQTQVLALCDVHRGRLESAKKEVESINKTRDDIGNHPFLRQKIIRKFSQGRISPPSQSALLTIGTSK